MLGHTVKHPRLFWTGPVDGDITQGLIKGHHVRREVMRWQDTRRAAKPTLVFAWGDTRAPNQGIHLQSGVQEGILLLDTGDAMKVGPGAKSHAKGGHMSAQRQEYLFAVFMPGSVHVAVVVEEPQFLAQQTMHHMGAGILPLKQASEGAAQGAAQVHTPIVGIQHQLGRRRPVSLRLHFLTPTEMFLMLSPGSGMLPLTAAGDVPFCPRSPQKGTFAGGLYQNPSLQDQALWPQNAGIL